jgi:ubiquinone/menaquinone biosynthesis C-methylase UbiE
LEDEIPCLFASSSDGSSQADVTQTVRAFYEETPFPNYDDFDSIGSLIDKARRGIFARMLDQQVPLGSRVLEIGCGTGQLSIFLSVSHRSIYATDICLNSLRLGQSFKRQNGLSRVHFVQMNLFHPAVKANSFHLVIANGVLHHTADPLTAYKRIARLVAPGGYLLVGLYHRFGRIITDIRRAIFRFSGDRFLSLDPNLRVSSASQSKKRAWFMDQYRNPHESKHTMGEVLAWIRQTGLEFVKSIPHSVPFRPFTLQERLFEPEPPGNAFERLGVELAMALTGSQEGGFFIMIARKPVNPGSGQGAAQPALEG